MEGPCARATLGKCQEVYVEKDTTPMVDLPSAELKRLRKSFTQAKRHAPDERSDEWKNFVRAQVQPKYKRRLMVETS